MPEHVIAMDPGGRSGWASARMSEDRLEMTGSGVLRQDMMANWFAHKQGIRFVGYGTIRFDAKGLAGREFDTVVYESWRPRRDAQGRLDWIEGDPLLSAQHVGQIRWIAAVSGMKIVEQHPSDKPQAVASMPQALLDWDVDSNEQHDKDARMHLWLYFWRNYFTTAVDPEDTVTS